MSSKLRQPFPLEVWLAVFEHVWETSLVDPNDSGLDRSCMPLELSRDGRATFHSLSLVCRGWNSAVEPYRWRQVSLRTIKDIKSLRRRARERDESSRAFRWVQTLWLHDQASKEACFQLLDLLRDFSFPNADAVVVHPAKHRNPASVFILDFLKGEGARSVRTLAVTFLGFDDLLSLGPSTSLATLAIRFAKSPDPKSTFYKVPKDTWSLPSLHTLCLGRLEDSLDPRALWKFLAKARFPALADLRLDVAWDAAPVPHCLDLIPLLQESRHMARFFKRHASSLKRIEMAVVDMWDAHMLVSGLVPVTAARWSQSCVLPNVFLALPRTLRTISFSPLRTSRAFASKLGRFLSDVASSPYTALSTIQICSLDRRQFCWDELGTMTAGQRDFVSALQESAAALKARRPRSVQVVDARGRECPPPL